MPKKGITGRDEWVVTEALATALVALEQLPAKHQPRTHMDEASLADLADSIKAQGVVQPILVRPVDGGRYEIVAGERRWRAAHGWGDRPGSGAGPPPAPRPSRSAPWGPSPGT